MRLYENLLVLRNTDASDIYRIHQRLDFHVQETCGTKLPYSWHHIQHPERPEATVVFIRSQTPLRMAGEKVRDVELEAGGLIEFNVLMNRKNVDRNGSTREKRVVRYLPCSQERMMEIAPVVLERCGLADTSVEHRGELSYPVRVDSKGRRPFALVGHNLHVVARISDVAAGIGSNRIFGFGMVRDLDLTVPGLVGGVRRGQ